MASAQRLLAVTYGGGHVAMVLPVLRELRNRRPDLEIHLLALTTARAAAAAEFGANAFGFAELLARWPDAKAELEGRRLLDESRHPAVAEDESIAYLGLNWIDLVRECGEEQARNRYAQQGRGAFYPIGTMRRLLAELRPDFVLATNSPRAEQAVLQAAVEADIPSLALFDLFPIEHDPYAARPVLAHHTVVISPAACDVLTRAGMHRSSIVVAGNPAFDSLEDPAHHASARRLRKRLGWEKKWVVLYAGYAEPVASDRWPSGTAFPVAIEDCLRAWVKAHSDTALIIRQHPNNWHLFCGVWDARGHDPRVHVSMPAESGVEESILASDVVVVQVSTVGVQAAVAGRRVLSMEESPSIGSAGFSWAKFGIAHGVPELGCLAAALDNARRESRPSRLQIPSPAAPRIAQLVAETLQNAVGS